MDTILGHVWGGFRSKPRIDDDFIDRLSHRYTINILVIFVIIVSSKQYVGEPINCWMPAHFTSSHEKYTNSYCLIQNTYYLPLTENVPKDNDLAKRRMIGYYQWVPMLLLIQCLLFYLPCLMWRALYGRAGINISKIIQLGKSVQINENDDELKTFISMRNHLDR